ncbi:MAG: glycoside hydrolase family 2 TIM barrel-domain containing protein [Ignisphaera sp.]
MKSLRSRVSLEGFWWFKLDPQNVGENEQWFKIPPGDKDLVYVPAAFNEQNPDWDQYEGFMWYWREFFVPREFSGKKVFLVFEGAGYRVKVWVNGAFVGDHECCYTKFSLDVSRHILFGEVNNIAVEIDNRVTPDSIPPGEGLNYTYYDFFPYGGIIRPVYLEFVAEDHVEDVIVDTDHEGCLKVRVDVVCRKDCRIRLRLTDRDGKTVYSSEATVDNGKVEVEAQVPKVIPWSPEKPYLYTLWVELLVDNKPVDIVYERIGFRKFEVKNGKLYLNGREVFLKGFSRHEDFPVFGRRLPGPVLIRDFNLMKKVNVNSFRTSHYPYSEEHLDLADELGFLVILETPLVGLNQHHFLNEEFFDKVKKVVYEMIKQHRNRPSVVIYSMANEPDNTVPESKQFFTKLKEYIRSLDPSRPVLHTSHLHHRNAEDPALEVDDIIALNIYYGWYTHVGDIEEGVKKALEVVESIHSKFPNKPIILTEFGAEAVKGLHSDPPVAWSEEYQALFLKRYIEEMSKLPYIKGLHIWVFADFRSTQGKRGPRRPGGMNMKGVFTRDRQPKLSANIVAELFAKM